MSYLKETSYANAKTIFCKYVGTSQAFPRRVDSDTWYFEMERQTKLAIVRESAAGRQTVFAIAESEAA